MNGAVYISFFQGQLESVLEQVVQLAVQEISKTVGSSLNALLLETAAKEQENQRLAVKLQQSREGERKAGTGGGTDGHHAADRDRSPPATVHHSARAGDSSSARTKPEQHAHTPGHGHGHGHGTDTRRLEQKGRVVGQLKTVMEQVLDFAVCELTKIVEASFDDLLLEITQKDREQHALEERLDRSTAAAGGGGGGGENGRAGGGGRRRGSENDSASPSGSDDAREDMEKESKEAASHERDKPAVISVSQDWVPILDKVFGQKWCSDIWQIKDEPRGGGGGRVGSGGGMEDSGSTPICDLEPSPTSPQQDPRWTPLEDMEVLSPEDDDVEHVLSVRHKPPPPVPQPVALGRGGGQAGHAPLGPALSPMADLSGHCSSASMLHRLLTLPAQLLDDDQDNADATETLAALATEIANCRQRESAAAAAAEPPDRLRAATYPLSPMTIKEEEEEEGDEEEDGGEEGDEDKGRKKKRRRVWLECEECGRRFSRASLLKAHRQTHNGGGGGGGGGDVVGMETSAPPSPLTQHHHHHHHVAAPTAVSSTTPSQQPGLRCPECGKRFSSASRLHSHLRSHHPGKRP